MVRRVRSGSTSSTASNLSSSAPDSCCSSSSSDSDANPTRVQWGPQRTPEKNWLRRVRKKDSREFVRRQSLGWDRSLRDRLESDDNDDDDASSAAGSSAGEAPNLATQSRCSNSPKSKGADLSSGEEAEQAAIAEPAPLLMSTITTRRAPRFSPAPLRGSDTDSSDSEGAQPVEVSLTDVADAPREQPQPPGVFVKTEPLEEDMPDAAPFPATSAGLRSHSTRRSPVPTKPLAESLDSVASGGSSSVRVVLVKEESADPPEPIPLISTVNAPCALPSASPLAAVELVETTTPAAVSPTDFPTAYELNWATEEVSLPPASPIRTERPTRDEDSTLPDADAATSYTAGLETTVLNSPRFEMYAQKSEAGEAPSSNCLLLDAGFELAAAAPAASLIDHSDATEPAPQVVNKESSVDESIFASEDSLSHVTSVAKSDFDNTRPATEIAHAFMDEAELCLGHVSTVSATDVIVDEAASPLLLEPHAASEASQPDESFALVKSYLPTSFPALAESAPSSILDMPCVQECLALLSEPAARQSSPEATVAQPVESSRPSEHVIRVAIDAEHMVVHPEVETAPAADEPTETEAVIELPALTEFAAEEPTSTPAASVGETVLQVPSSPTLLAPSDGSVVGVDDLILAASGAASTLNDETTHLTPLADLPPAQSALHTEPAPCPKANLSESEVSAASRPVDEALLSVPTLDEELLEDKGYLPVVSPLSSESGSTFRTALVENDQIPVASASTSELIEGPSDETVSEELISLAKARTTIGKAAREASLERRPATPTATNATPVRSLDAGQAVDEWGTPAGRSLTVETSQSTAISGSHLTLQSGASPRSDTRSLALSTPPVNREAFRPSPGEQGPIVRSIRSRIAKAAVAGSSLPPAETRLAQRPRSPTPPAVTEPCPPPAAESSRQLPMKRTLRTPTVSGLPLPPARPTRAARIPQPSSSAALRADAPAPPPLPPPQVAPAARRPLRPTIAVQSSTASTSIGSTTPSSLTAAPKRKAPTPSSAGITPAARAPRSRKPLAAVPPAAAIEISDAKLQSLTLLNTRSNQAYFSPLEKVVVRKEGQNRPESPGPKVRKAGSGGLSSRATLGKGRALFDPPPGDGGADDWSDEEGPPPTPERHVRGPGDLEDYESPMRAPPAVAARGSAAFKAKIKVASANIIASDGLAEPASQPQAQASGRYSVRWNKGLVLIRSRNSTAPEPEHRSRPTGPKSAIKPVPKLDAFGNIEPAVPLTQVLKRTLVTYTKIIYDDDLPPPPAATSTKKGRK